MSREQDGPKLDAPVVGAYRYGTLTGCYYMRSQKFGHPELKVVGNWEGEGQGHWWANWKAVTALCQAGMLAQLSGDGKKFQVTPGTRCCIYRTVSASDPKAHDWFVTPCDGQGAAVTMQPNAVPFEPQDSAQSAPPPPPGQPGVSAGPPPPPQLSGQPSSPDTPPVPPASDSTAEQRNKDRAKRERQLVSQVDAVLGMSLAIAAYQHVKTFNKSLMDLDEGAVQDSAATVMIRLEHLGFDPSKDRSPAYLKRLRRLEFSLFPDRCPDPDADAKPPEEKPKRRSRAKPKEEKPEPEPPPMSTVPGSTFADPPEALAEDGEDDLPF